MTTNQTIVEQIQSIRTATMALIDEMRTQAEASQLPEPPAGLEESRRRLATNNFQVLVVGEAKRGKSSFINALIGRELLPTDVGVATSQVFRVRNTEQEAYRIRFEDDSFLAIQAEDLSKYGSQVIINNAGLPDLKQVIRWIEVDIPTHFLPEHVNILDTPGLGTLYAGHAQITRRFVPLADAVIFVLDSLRPIIQAEVDFIETLLSVTSNIIFVQTKIDMQRVADWQEIQRRNQEILHQQFEKRLPDTRVWPVSSVHLFRASDSNEEDAQDFLEMSQYGALAAALQVFLFRAAGWERSIRALLTIEDYFFTVRKSLENQLAPLSEVNAQKRAELQQRIAEREQAFAREWGPSGQEKALLLGQIRQIIRTNQQAFLFLLQRNGELETKERHTIDGLLTIQEASNYNSRMADRVVGTFLDTWRAVCQSSRDEILTLLMRFLVASDAFEFDEDPQLASLIITEMPDIISIDISGKVKEKVLSEVNIIMGTAKILSTFLDDGPSYNTTTNEVTVPSFIEGLANLATMCYIAIRGQTLSTQLQLEDAKNQLHHYLDELLRTVREQFQERQMGVGGQSRVESFFSTLEQRVETQMEQISEQKTREAQEELARFAHIAQMNEQERTARAEELQQQLTTWARFSPSLKALKQSLQDIQRVLDAFLQPGA